MGESDGVLIETSGIVTAPVRNPTILPNEEWIARLSAPGPARDQAIEGLHDLMIRAAWHQINRMTEAIALGAVRREEVVLSAANEATVSVLARLSAFEGRSRFTTWAYKFGIHHAGVEVRRASWRDREVALYSIAEPRAMGPSPESYTEVRDLAAAVHEGIERALTPHQQRVAVALLVDEVPIDVLADRLATTRNALYKTLHDARKRLRTYLATQGYLNPPDTKEMNR